MTKQESGPDRRKAKRHRHRVKVRFWWGEFEGTGFTRDVSSTGMLIETNKQLEIGSRLHVEMSLQDESFFCEVVVARLKKYPRAARAMFHQGFGVRLVGLNETVKEIQRESESTDTQMTQDTRVLTLALPKLPVGDTRQHIPMEVDLSTPEELEEVYNRDIKHGGLMVRTTELPEIYSEVTVPVHLPPPNGTIECHGQVVKVFEDPEGIAVRLSEVDAVRARLIEIIRPK